MRKERKEAFKEEKKEAEKCEGELTFSTLLAYARETAKSSSNQIGLMAILELNNKRTIIHYKK